MINFLVEVIIPFLTYLSFMIGTIHLVILEKGIVSKYIRNRCNSKFRGVDKFSILLILVAIVPVAYMLYSTSLFGLSLIQLVPVISCVYYCKYKADRSRVKKGVKNGFLL